MSWPDLLNGSSATRSWALVFLLGGYVIGCFNTAYYLVRFRTGQDIRRLGTGTGGAKNVSRVLGRTGFLLTVAGDVLKGAICSSAALAVTGDDRICLLAIMGVVAGHVWPVQLGFRGGKGVATSLGALLMYDWKLTLFFCVSFALGYALTKKSTVCGLISYALLPVAARCLHQDVTHIIGVSALAGLVILTHYKNVAAEISQLSPGKIAPSAQDPSLKS